MSITNASGSTRARHSSSSPPEATASVEKPSSRRPRTRTLRSWASSSTRRILCPRATLEVLLLAQDRPERQAAELEHREAAGRERTDDRRRAEPRQERPRDGEVVGRRVEDVAE